MARDKLMTVDEVANYLNKPRSWVYGNWKAEQIPFRKVGQSLVKALAGIAVTVERAGKTGRPATVFSLRDDTSRHAAPQPARTYSNKNRDASRHAEAQPASAEREQNRARVVRLDAYRVEPKQAASQTEQQPKGPEPLTDFNPFRALL
ncbi:hypothetical protein ACPF8X_09520 [Streptomyces sp. G35A]